MRKTVLFMMVFALTAAMVACQPQAQGPVDATPEQSQRVAPPSSPPSDIGEMPPPEDIKAEAKPATDEPTPRTELKKKVAPQEHWVTIARYAFSPKVVEINAGDRVIWKNLGNTPHEVLSSEFHSNPLFKDDEFSYVFDERGNYTVNSARYKATQMVVVVG